MTIVGAVLGAVLGIAQLILLARVVLDWAVVLAGPPAPGGARDRLTQALYRMTEPVLAPLRRVIPPLRVGGVGIDLSVILLFLLISVLRSIVSGL